MKKLRCILFVWIIVMSGFSCVISIIPEDTTAYTPHDPILIEGNSNFTSQAAGEGAGAEPVGRRGPGRGGERGATALSDKDTR